MIRSVQDMTEGRLGKQIFVFSLPLMLSNVLQVLFNMTDIAVVGRFAGSAALGSVGSTAILITLFTGFPCRARSCFLARPFGTARHKG